MTPNTKSKYGKIISIEEIFNHSTRPVGSMNGLNGSRLGSAQMFNAIYGSDTMDGYRVTTDTNKILVLISNGQSCCENWGYFSSESDMSQFVGAELLEVNLTDVALNKERVEESGYYDDQGGIQLVDFVTTNGVFQLAVYNAHNGYYGHGIVVAIDNEVIHEDTL